MKINPINTTTFKAIPIAKAKVYGVEGQYKLYNITRKDLPFLSKFIKNLNLEKLALGFNEKDYKIWKNIIRSGINTAEIMGRNAILCTYNKKPCGVLNYTDTIIQPVKANYAATWSIEPQKKVPLANRIMFYTLFTKIANKDKSAELYALNDSPYNPVIKYLQLGFTIDDTYIDESYVKHMTINKDKMQSSLNKLAQTIKLTPLEKQTDVNLKKELDIVV